MLVLMLMLALEKYYGFQREHATSTSLYALKKHPCFLRFAYENLIFFLKANINIYNKH